MWLTPNYDLSRIVKIEFLTGFDVFLVLFFSVKIRQSTENGDK